MKLNNPPYLQIALDFVNAKKAMALVDKLPDDPKILLEAGTPLIKAVGINIVAEIKAASEEAFVVADLKTMDVGALEVELARKAGADAACVAGAAPAECIESFVRGAQERDIVSVLDMLGVDYPAALLGKLRELPDVVLLHRGIDTEKKGNDARAKGKGGRRSSRLAEEKHRWDSIAAIKQVAKKRKAKVLVAVAGGIRLENVKEALKKGADIIIVGRGITQAKDPNKAANDFLAKL